jgi:hypothetical protein
MVRGLVSLVAGVLVALGAVFNWQWVFWWWSLEQDLLDDWVGRPGCFRVVIFLAGLGLCVFGLYLMIVR